MNALPTPSQGLTVTPSHCTSHHGSSRAVGSAASPAPCLSDGEGSGSRGEGVATFPIVEDETAADVAARDPLLDRAMGPRWRRKSSEKLRRGRLPAAGLAFVAKDERGAVVGTVRLWEVGVAQDFSPLEGEMSAKPTEGVRAAERDIARPHPDPLRGSTLPSRGRGALLLGPLAVDGSVTSAGIGSALMRHAIAEARRLGHGAILLVGDAAYYGRFGFSAEKTDGLAMPGPYEKHRFLALELADGALDGAAGVLRPTGRREKPAQRRAATRLAA